MENYENGEREREKGFLNQLNGKLEGNSPQTKRERVFSLRLMKDGKHFPLENWNKAKRKHQEPLSTHRHQQTSLTLMCYMTAKSFPFLLICFRFSLRMMRLYAIWILNAQFMISKTDNINSPFSLRKFLFDCGNSQCENWKVFATFWL